MVLERASRIDPALLNRAILQRFLAEIRSAGIRPMIVQYPFLDEYLRDRRGTDEFLGGCGPGVMCVDAFPAFAEAHARGVTLTTGVHFSPAGHRIVAEAIAEEIRRHGPAE
jgi:lysophospholipase L1-like esterase